MAGAVQDGQLLTVSPSQIKDYLRCGRYWYFKKVLRIKEPETNAQAIGTARHKEMEDFYELGTPPPSPSCLMALRLKDIPPRHPTVIIEEPSDYNTGLVINGTRVQARADVLHTFEDTGDAFEVIDWKTRGRKNYETPEALRSDVQAIVYLKWGFDNLPECNHGRFRHVYIRTDCFDADTRKTDWLSRSEVDDLYNELVVPTVLEMQTSAAQPTPETVPAIPKNCWKYGKPCFYADRCSATTIKNVARSTNPNDPLDGIDDII